MHANLLAFLAPLRSTDWSTWSCSPRDLLAERATSGRRYGGVPPEAVPVLDLGVDGCHYAVWLDDPGAVDVDPPVVRVSPSDPHPDRIVLVAPSIRAFRHLLRPDDDWLHRADPALDAQRREAERKRAKRVTAQTIDGIGVVEPGATKTKVPDEAEAAIRHIHELLASDAAPSALVLARDVVASDFGFEPGLGHAIAAVYRALGRTEYAEVALRSYEPTPMQLERSARIAALRREARER